MKIAAVAAIVALSAGSPAEAWGDRGHRAIADIAWTQLSTVARQQVGDLLQAAPELSTPACPAGSLADAATWADCVRSRYHERYAATATWHYVDVSICRPFELPDDPEATSVVARYERERAILADRRNSRVSRLEALLWVAHLVGDLHQPLHVGDDSDRGGNEVDVYPQSSRYHVNLHAEWDRVLVDDAIRSVPGGVADLAAEAGAESQRQYGTSPIMWARESWELARRTAYPARAVGGGCGSASPAVDVGSAYRATAIPVVQQQLERAGVRLAVVLNTAMR